MNRASPLRWRQVALVVLGGALGTAAREAATLVWPAPEGVPYAVLVVNILGAFLLGLLYSVLGRAPETERLRDIRALLGAGVLGGFTTYSALASDTARLWSTEPLLAAAYAGGSILAGVAAAALGIRLGSRPTPGRRA